MSFAEKFNSEKLFSIDCTDFEYKSLEDLYLESNGDETKIYPIFGVYINTKGLYDPAPVIASDGYYVNLPAHLTSVCREMINDKATVNAINKGKCGFTIYSYEKKKYHKTCFSVIWVDM